MTVALVFTFVLILAAAYTIVDRSREVDRLRRKLAERESAPDWRHDSSVSAPPAEHWATFLRDIQPEGDDEARLECLRRWVARGSVFTDHEMVEISSLFMAPEVRAEARRLFDKDAWAYCCVANDGERTYLRLGAGHHASETEARARAEEMLDELIEDKDLSEPETEISVLKVA